MLSSCRWYNVFSWKQGINRGIVKKFTLFSRFPGLKPNISKCEISVLGPLKRVEMAVFGIQLVDLTTDAIKILDIYFSYNINLMNQKNYCKAIISIHDILKLWRTRNLSIGGKIVVFKKLDTSYLQTSLSVTSSCYSLTYYRRSSKNIKNLLYHMIHPLKLNIKH